MKIKDPAVFLILCYLSATFAHVSVQLIAYHYGETINSFQLIFLQSSVGVLFVAFLALQDKKIIQTESIKKQISRGVLGAVGHILWCYALFNMTLSTGLVLRTTTIFLTYIGSVLFLKEKLHLFRLLCCIIASIGVGQSIRVEDLT